MSVFKWKRDFFCGGITPPWRFYWISWVVCIVFLLPFHVPPTPTPWLWVTFSTIPSTFDLAQLEPNSCTLSADWLAWRRYQRNPSCSKGKSLIAFPLLLLCWLKHILMWVLWASFTYYCCWRVSFNLEKLIVVLGLSKGSRRHYFFFFKYMSTNYFVEKVMIHTLKKVMI